MEPSVFTRIVRGELPAAKVYEDEHTIVFMDAGQVNPKKLGSDSNFVPAGCAGRKACPRADEIGI